MAQILLVDSVIRACLNCGIVRTFSEFFYQGCPNCENYLKFRANIERILHCSTGTYFNLRLLPEGYSHWKASTIPVASFAYGIYAYCAYGMIPYEILCQIYAEGNA